MMEVVVDEDHISWDGETRTDLAVRTRPHFVDGLNAKCILVLRR